MVSPQHLLQQWGDCPKEAQGLAAGGPPETSGWWAKQEGRAFTAPPLVVFNSVGPQPAPTVPYSPFLLPEAPPRTGGLNFILSPLKPDIGASLPPLR